MGLKKLLSIILKTSVSELCLHLLFSKLIKKVLKSWLLLMEVEILAKGTEKVEGFQGVPVIIHTSAKNFMNYKQLEEEVFGPSTLIVTADENHELY